LPNYRIYPITAFTELPNRFVFCPAKHEDDDEDEGRESHRGDRYVAVIYEIDELAARTGRGAGDERVAAELEIGMVGAHEAADGAQPERKVPDERAILPLVLVFSREEGDEKDDGFGIQEPALDPAEFARFKVGEFRIEKAADDRSKRDEE